MKKLLISLLIVIFAFSLFAASNLIEKSQEVKKTTSLRLDREIEVFYEEGFEDGLGGWTTLDGTAPDDWEVWHLSTTGAYAGNSWWMGDEALGGYYSHRYLVLDTPELNVPATGYTLTFKVAWNVEAPGGEPEGYNGWDGCNVEVSTDGGNSFTAITGTPAYGATSLYSFGDEFNEGPGVPGWVGDSEGWQPASFNLNAFSGQNIIIRFAFCSDPLYDTTNNADMFGMKIDNVLVSNQADTIFESDGEGASGDTQFVPGFGGVPSGDFWEITATNPHAGVNVAHCPVEPNLINSLISSEIVIPADAEEINIDYYVFCDMLDSDGNGDNNLEDMYNVYVKGIEETDWTRLHYNFNGPENGGVSSNWMLMDQAYAIETWGWQSGTCDISDWIGETVQLKFTTNTDDNDDGGIGQGLYIDDVRVYSVYDVGPPPEDVQATTTDDNTVLITWVAPGSAPPDPGWHSYYTEISHLSWVGPERATKYELSESATFTISKVKHIFYEHTDHPWGTDTTFKFKIYDSDGATLLFESTDVTALQYPTETELTFDPVEVTGSFYLSIAPTNTTTGMPSSAANQSATSHSYDGGAGSWNANSLEWASFVYVDDSEGKTLILGKDDTEREIIGYKIYHSDMSGGNFVLIGSTDATVLEFLHEDPLGGVYNYYVVTAVYTVGDSPYSEEANAFVPPLTPELFYDDGTAEESFNIGSPNQIQVKFTPDYTVPLQITHFKFYITTEGIGQVVVRIFDDNGADGMPGLAPIYTKVLSGASLYAGWNYITIDDLIVFSEGAFYAGVLEMPGSPAFGLDTNTQGNTYFTSGITWGIEESGNILFRLFVTDYVSTDEEEIVPAENVTISNYPNPFNPETTIKLNIPNSGNTSLKIYNMKGQLVKTLCNDIIEAGQREFIWKGNDDQGRNVTSGLYFYKLITDDKTITKKMLLLK